MKKQGRGWASGKIILMGEHAVVYGEPAIAFPFKGTEIYANFYNSPDENTLNCQFYQGPLAKAPATLKSVKALVHKLTLDYPIQQQHFTLEIQSTIPAERGMGSSAAVAVAITRAFFNWIEQTPNSATMLYYINHAEKVAHGNPSGLDAAAICGEQPLFFIKGQSMQPIPLNIDAVLVVADTGIKGQTRTAVKDVAVLFETAKKETSHKISQLGELTRRAHLAISTNQPVRLGQLMTNAHELLKQLTVSNTELNHLVEVALANEALGAKMTGGGRGGCMITLARDVQSAKNIQKNLLNAGARAAWIQGLGVYEHV